MKKMVIFLICLMPAITMAQKTSAKLKPKPAIRAPAQIPDPDKALPADDDDIYDEIDYRVTLEEKESRFYIAIYSEMSTFDYQGRALMGAGFTAMANYAMFPRVGLGLALTQALNFEGGLSLIYTGIRAVTSYALSGKFLQRESLLSVDGQTTFMSTLGQGPLWTVDFGINQLMFNGTTRIVPATGLSVGFRHERTWGRWNLSFLISYGSLVISESVSSMMSAGIGITMRF